MIYDKGLLRAMKAAYRDDGYCVALTEKGLLIQGAGWGVEISRDAVPNSVKSLIVLHNGGMPEMNKAVSVKKGECGELILEVAVNNADVLSEAFTESNSRRIKPTTLTFEGCRVWQTTDSLEIRLVDPDDQQILTAESFEAFLVRGHIYGRSWFGQMYVQCQTPDPDHKIQLDHLAQLQWIPVEMG